MASNWLSYPLLWRRRALETARKCRKAARDISSTSRLRRGHRQRRPYIVHSPGERNVKGHETCQNDETTRASRERQHRIDTPPPPRAPRRALRGRTTSSAGAGRTTASANRGADPAYGGLTSCLSRPTPGSCSRATRRPAPFSRCRSRRPTRRRRRSPRGRPKCRPALPGGG